MSRSRSCTAGPDGPPESTSGSCASCGALPGPRNKRRISRTTQQVPNIGGRRSPGVSAGLYFGLATPHSHPLLTYVQPPQRAMAISSSAP
eukprot:scaffold2739_cov257-Pinguiococcus_pyrenoidosus.AAC.28